MSYRGFQIQTINYPTGWWHAHIQQGEVEFTTLPASRKFESEAWEDGKRKIDDVLQRAESIDESLEEVW